MMTDRHQTLRAMGLLDSPPDAAFDRLTRLACRLLDVPVALISFIDEERQFFKSARGLAEPWATRHEIPLSHAFCQHIVAADQLLIIRDARQDPRLCNSSAIYSLSEK